jgi:BolA family transcriptional regulator, general stress-responsive regulator
MSGMKTQIEDKLTAAFAPVALTVTDDSALHAGHAGAPEGGESHFTVQIVSAAFSGQSRIARHRAVNQALAEELAGPVHALAVKAKAPGE